MERRLDPSEEGVEYFAGGLPADIDVAVDQRVSPLPPRPRVLMSTIATVIDQA